jgi:hypothetical protein
VQEQVRRVGVAFAGVALVAAAVATLGLSHANSVAAGEPTHYSVLFVVAAFLSIPLVGVCLLWLRPAQPVARLLVAVGWLVTASQLANSWAFYSLRTHPGSLPGGSVAAWVATWMLVPGFGLGPFLLLTFPDGRVERRWLRAAAVVGAVALGIVTVAQSLAPDQHDGGPPGVRAIRNPWGVEGLRGAVSIVTGVGVLVVVALLVVASADLVLRYRKRGVLPRAVLRLRRRRRANPEQARLQGFAAGRRLPRMGRRGPARQRQRSPATLRSDAGQHQQGGDAPAVWLEQPSAITIRSRAS